MENNSVILIGGSAGSVSTLFTILPLLADNLEHPIVLVLHRRATDEIALAELLQLKSKNKVVEIEDKMVMVAGKIYLAPANYHLLIESNFEFTLDYSEKINYSRPNIDACMESFVQVFGNKVIGILLTGSNNDGAAGMKLISDSGGFTILQSYETCEFPQMPMSAEKIFKPNSKFSPAEIAGFISNLKQLSYEKLFP